MAQPFVTGPVWIYVGIGNAVSKTPVFLGTAEDGPKKQHLVGWEPVMNDVTGSKKPLDQGYQGESAIVRADLTRYNEDVLAALVARPNPFGTRGLNAFGDLGALMLTEGLAYPLWLRYPYASKAAYSTMPPGDRFVASWLVSPEDYVQGTKPKKVSVIWYCQGVFSPVTGGVLLYDHDMTGLPDIN